MTPPSDDIVVETTLDGYTIHLPFLRMPTVLAFPLVITILLSIVTVVAVLGAGLAIAVSPPRGAGSLSELTWMAISLTGIGLGVAAGIWGMMRAAAWIESGREDIAIHGQQLTVTRPRYRRTVDLSSVASTAPDPAGVAVVLRDGERVLVGASADEAARDWLREVLGETLRQRDHGSPQDVPADLRAVRQPEGYSSEM